MGVAMAGIFIADTVTDYAIAAAVFYTAVILVATRILSGAAVVVLACICVALTLISFFLTPSGAYEVGIVNTGISIVAIGVTTYLSLRMVAAKAEALEARDRLLRIARVTTLGQLSASIAHEVNQPLAAVVASGGACARWLSQEPPNLEKARRALDRIVSDANRASQVIARIRALSKGEAPHRQPFDLREAVREIVTLSRSEIERSGIALQLRVEFFDGDPADHVASIRRLQLDVAFITGTAQWSDCQTEQLWSERVFAVLPSDHPLSEKPVLSWSDLAGERFIVSDGAPGSEIHDYLVQRLADLGRHPEIHTQYVGRDNLLSLVAIGRGLTVMSEAGTAAQFPGTVYRQLVDEVLPFCAVWSPRNDNPAWRRLLSLARSMSRSAAATIIQATAAILLTSSPLQIPDPWL